MMIVDAICGARFSAQVMEQFTKIGIARFIGNQHNENWQFNRDKLENLTPIELMNIYEMRVK